jgi:phytoene dehydrogenase-like protein
MAWLCHQFTEAGGVLMESCSVIRIDSKPEIIVDVEGKGPSVSLRGKKLIVHSQWEKLRLLLGHEKSFRRVEKKLDAFPPSLFPFSLHLGVHEEGLPEPLAPCAIIVPDIKASAVDPNPLLLVSSPSGDTQHAPEGKRAITLTKYLKKSPLTMADSELRETAQEMLTSLDGFLPFLRESIDYVNIEKSIELSRQSQEIVSPSYVPRQGAIIGLTTFPHETALNHVFLNGGILRAGLGFEGELLAALDVARTVRMEIKKME